MRSLLLLCLVAALVGGGWGLLTRSLFSREGRWPALVILLLSLSLPAALAWNWPKHVYSAIALDAPNNSAAALAAANGVAGQFAWAVRLAVLGSVALTAGLLWRGHGAARWLAPLGPLVMAGLLWLALPLRNGIQLSAFQPDMGKAVVVTGALCLCASVCLLGFVSLAAPRSWRLETV
ncbi:hypothetical protein ACFP81_08045 [Deinococcus lacus]|uniref:Uncharacterized protein n=1 Tax=Deinococcus lacus TaxID=392561 RepID=A0ABW1YCD9_9DEIO